VRTLALDLARFARGHVALSVALVVVSCVGGLLLAGVDSPSWLVAFVGLAVVYFGFALVDLREEFRRRSE
jgi:type IV secretory pathway VirB2 component (pilin)